jgi:hypothetical protein
MKRSGLGVLAASVLMREVLFLWMCGFGVCARAAGPAGALEAARPDAVQELQELREGAPAEDGRVKKRGRVRIATLGPRPLSVDPKADPQRIVEQMIAHWRREFAQVCRTGRT